MSNGKQFTAAVLLFAALGVGPGFVTLANAGAREEGRLLTATEVLQAWRRMQKERSRGQGPRRWEQRCGEGKCGSLLLLSSQLSDVAEPRNVK